MIKQNTERGFTYFEFKDRYDQPCSLQESSLATEACIWLGVHTQIDLNTKEEIGPGLRMHLTQSQVMSLLPHLVRFAETGELA